MRPGRIGTWCRQRLTLTNEWHAGNIKSGARRACFGSGPMSKGLDLSALDKKTLTEKETHESDEWAKSQSGQSIAKELSPAMRAVLGMKLNN